MGLIYSISVYACSGSVCKGSVCVCVRACVLPLTGQKSQKDPPCKRAPVSIVCV